MICPGYGQLEDDLAHEPSPALLSTIFTVAAHGAMPPQTGVGVETMNALPSS